MFGAVGPDPQGDDQAVLADVDTVEHEADQIQVVEGRRLPCGELGRRLGDEAAADGALADASTGDIERQRLQTPRVATGADANQQLLDGTTLQRIGLCHRPETRQRHFPTSRAHPWAADRHLPPTEHHLTGHGPSPRGRAVGLVCVAWPADRYAILFEHGFQYLQPGPYGELEQLRLGIHQQLDEGQATRGRGFNTSGWTDCARLLHGGSFAVRRFASGCPPLVYHEQ